MVYTPRIVRAVIATLYSSGGDSELRADVVQAINQLHPLWRRVLVLQAQGYSGLEIGRKVLGQDAWHVEGELLLVLAELELVVRLNRGKA